MLSTRVYVLITAGRCYLCVTLLGPCSLLPLAGEQQKLCLCEGEALASALSQALSECLVFFVCYVAHVFVSFVEQLSLSALWSLDCGQDHPVHGSGGIRSL